MKLKIVTVCFLAALTQAPRAFADVGTVTYYGTVANTQTLYYPHETVVEPAPDFDVANLFGGGNLEGDEVVATLTYSTSYGSEFATPGVSDQLYGGSAYQTASPLMSASLTIQQANTLNIYTYTFTPNYYSTVSTSATDISEFGTSTTGASINTSFGPAVTGPTSLSQSFSTDGYGPGNSFLTAFSTAGADTIVFETQYVTVSALPEPAEWALMLLGVGAAGLRLRYSRARRPSSGDLFA